MKTNRMLVACVLMLLSGSLFAQPTNVGGTISGVGPNVVVSGTVTGTRVGNAIELVGQTIRTEFNDNGTVSVWTQDIEVHVNLSLMSGDWETSNCIDVSGPVFCALGPPTSGTWDSVAGNPRAFTTTENGTTLTWALSDPAQIPTMPRNGIALIIIGMILVAGSRLKRNGPSI